MSAQEFYVKMCEIKKRLDDEQDVNYYERQAHEDADKLMMKLLRQLGYSDGISVFANMDKWYA